MQKIFRNKSLLFTFIYIILGCIALIAFSRIMLPTGYTLGGHDSGLPFNSKDFFVSRLFAWNPNIGFGVDNSYLFGSLTLHFFDLFSSYVAHTPYAGNWFNLFFWLVLIFISATVFAYSIKKHLGQSFVYLFPPLTIFNFYIFQSIFILERAKYSIFVGIFLFLAVLFKFLDKKISMLPASILTALIFFIFNGGSLLGISLYGNLLVIVLAIFVFYLIKAVKERNFSQVLRLIYFLVLSAIFLVIVNSYQIFPYLPGILDKSYMSHLGASVSQSKDWVNYISQNTSIINILRLEGVPTWYSGSGLFNTEHTYASIYLGNIFFIFVSFLFFLIICLGFFFAKKSKTRKILLLFFLIIVVSVPFSAGTHAPFGFIYGFLYDHVPGFFIFRNPYYKFAGGFFIGVSAAIAASLSILFNKITKKAVIRLFYPRSLFHSQISFIN